MISKLRVDSVSRKLHSKVSFYYLSCNKPPAISDCVIAIYLGRIHSVIADATTAITAGLRNVIVRIVRCIIICLCIKRFGFLALARIVL